MRSLSKSVVSWTFVCAALVAVVIAFVFGPSTSAGALPASTDQSTCVNDSDGANDEPGQKDLTRWCTGPAASGSIQIAWNWDETFMPGTNTADGCALFDTDSDGLVNRAVCESWEDSGPLPSPGYPVVYSCNDTRPYNCAGAKEITANGTSCTLGISADDPFLEGKDSPNDVKATCTISFDDVGGPSATVLDVCSYPSQQPTSDASDCVAISEVHANLNVLKDVKPDDESTGWDITVTGPTPFTDTFAGDDSTGIKAVTAGDYQIQEAAAEGTSFDYYVATWSCNLDGEPVASGMGTSIPAITASAGSVLSCTFTNSKASIDLAKYTSGDNVNFYDSDTCGQWTEPDAPDYCVPVAEGSTVYWKYVITNSGQVDLSNIALVDDPIPASGFACSPIALGGVLLPGSSTTCTASGVATGSGLYENTGTASGTFGKSKGVTADVSATDLGHYYGYSATITLLKLTTPENSDHVFNFTLRDANGATVFAPLTDLPQNPFGRTAQQPAIVMKVIPGVYELAEADPYVDETDNWKLTDITCSKNGNPVGTWSGEPSLVVTGLAVDNGEVVNCTFTNKAVTGPTAVSVSALSATRRGDLPYALVLAFAACAITIWTVWQGKRNRVGN